MNRYPASCKRTQRWRMHNIKYCNDQAGRYFFAPDTLKFFKSRILDRVHQGSGGIFFVTSERPPHSRRDYTLREFHPKTGQIDTVGERGEYSSTRAAHSAAQSKAKGGK